MAKRKAKRKSPVKRKTARRKTTTKRKKAVKSVSNSISYWEAYRSLQRKVDKAWAKLKSDVKRKAKPQILIHDKSQLLLLLGECNYMARECMRIASRSKKGR